MPAPLILPNVPNDSCADCHQTATRLVEIFSADGTLFQQLRACVEHARKYAADEAQRKVLVRMLALTTSVMLAPIRSRHTKIVLMDNGLVVSEEGDVTRVTSEHVGPTHVSCDISRIDRVREVLNFQGWQVRTAPGVLTELLVDHPTPEQAYGTDEITPGIAHAVTIVRLDELDKITRMIDDLKWGEDDAEVLRTLGMVDHALDARRLELGRGASS